ncbi:transcriptional regulator, TetR family [Marinactinospora thermotolerans DSM 45154]|uniref:Transcriptional regulator, TetR family n=1 Tax=Marinactinospora thermotolerans DSM 45154 TaxID=1122192 RepID=A0A1T4NHF5_9ACTN|nr:TetR family transcriptional regulator [Marinactinospora thermotolerans]SJZ78575.1 transcriptional regulator, TetR family [Marinactinospora thermotolerans DSM 45154]
MPETADGPGTTEDPAAPGRRTRRNDPERRDRIIDACLDVIVERGVAGASHRKIAEAAGVPLGSMTYHFDGMNELLREAFHRFALGVSDRFERRMAEAADAQEAAAAVVALVTGDVLATRRDLVLTSELYTLAAREPEFRDLTNRWMARSRAALGRHFDPVTAIMLDALIEGLTLHRGLDTDPYDAAVVVEAVERIVRSGD